MKFIVKYFPEITIKSRPVRKQLTKLLQDNLRASLKRVDPAARVERSWDYITVNTSSTDPSILDAVIETLRNTSGIAHFVDAVAYPLGDLDDIYQRTQALWGQRLTGKTFVVRCKRSGKHDFSSSEVERYVGGGLNQHNQAKGVDLHNPDITVRLEIRGDTLYVINRRFEGPGGFPLGAVEPVLSLISGGFDSTVASYLTMRRGMRTHFCFFNLGGRDHELGVKEVAYYLWQHYGANQRVKFASVPFEPVVAEILKNIHHSQMGVVLKRMMLRAASQVAGELKIKALVTGESVAQVSSQTLTNLTVIDRVTETLVLRPLITYHKNEIIQLAGQIGTATFAAHMPEYCGVISVKPTTRARHDRIAAEESKFDFSVLEQAVAKAQILNIDQLELSDEDRPDVEILPVPLPDSDIIDIRAPAEEERKPLRVTGTTVRKIPFYELHSRLTELPRDRTYLLYCDQGVMSRLHASHLLAEGYEHIKVYRPDRH